MKIAVIIPTLNEEKTIGGVIDGFRRSLPKAELWVVDGHSTDDTAKIAKAKKAGVLLQQKSGKGNALREAFERIKADIYVVCDGDGTYDPSESNRLLAGLQGADVVVGSRMLGPRQRGSVSVSHGIGNMVVTALVNKFFRTKLTDVLSGFRAVRRSVVDGMVLVSPGFEIESEMTIKSLIGSFRIVEIPISYHKRTGSRSKLSGWRDGYLIVSAIISLFRDYRPFLFFGALAVALFVLSLLLSLFPVFEVLQYGRIIGMGKALLSMLMFMTSVQVFVLGLLSDMISRRIDNQLVPMIKRAVPA